MDKLINPQVDDLQLPPGPLNLNVGVFCLHVHPQGADLFVAFVNTNNIDICGMGSTGVWKSRPPTVVSSQSQVAKRSTIKNDHLGVGFKHPEN